MSEKPYHVEQETPASLSAKIVHESGSVFMTCDAGHADFMCRVANAAYAAGLVDGSAKLAAAREALEKIEEGKLYDYYTMRVVAREGLEKSK